MAQSAAPPTPQEVTRKLSIHSAVKPKVRAVAGGVGGASRQPMETHLFLV